VSGLGWLAVVVAPVAVGFYFLLAARAGESTSIGAVVGQATLAAALVILVIAPLLPGGEAGIVQVGARPAALLVLNGLVSFFLAPFAYFRAIAREGYVVPPMLMTAIPAFTLVLSALVLHLPVALLALAGIPVAIVGGVLILRAESERPDPGRSPAGGAP
jgi:drug/metabolite transporter (DMT)-like permease